MKQPLGHVNGTAMGMATVSGRMGEEDVPPEDLQLQSCFESEGFIKFQYTMDDLLLAASTASTLFNLLVIFCAFRLFKRSGDTMHVFIINMTFGDLLLTVFCHPNEFLIRKHAFLRHVHLCAIIHYCNWLGLAVSGLSLTLLNVDKLIYFRWPLSYERTMSKRRAICLCVGVWGVSLGFVSYVWLQNIVFVTADCMLQMADNSKYFYEIFMILFCVLPVSSSLVVSTYLFQLTRQKLSPRVGPQSNGVVDMPTFKSKLRSLVFIFATTAWTSFSLLPYRIFNICRIHLFDWPNITCDQRVLMNWVAWILLYLLTLNPIVNPLITALIYAPYRLHLKKLLLNIPGNRLQYSTYRTGDGVTESSHISIRRVRRRGERLAGAARNGALGDQIGSGAGQGQQPMIGCGGEDSSTTTSSSSRRPPPIPLVHLSSKRDTASADAPLSAKSSEKSGNSTKSATAKFVFVDEEEARLQEEEEEEKETDALLEKGAK